MRWLMILSILCLPLQVCAFDAEIVLDPDSVQPWTVQDLSQQQALQNFAAPAQGETVKVIKITNSFDEELFPELLHMVTSGESLVTIAEKYNLVPQDFQSYNNKTTKTTIHPDEELRIPLRQSVTLADSGFIIDLLETIPAKESKDLKIIFKPEPSKKYERIVSIAFKNGNGDRKGLITFKLAGSTIEATPTPTSTLTLPTVTPSISTTTVILTPIATIPATFTPTITLTPTHPLSLTSTFTPTPIAGAGGDSPLLPEGNKENKPTSIENWLQQHSGTIFCVVIIIFIAFIVIVIVQSLRQKGQQSRKPTSISPNATPKRKENVTMENKSKSLAIPPTNQFDVSPQPDKKQLPETERQSQNLMDAQSTFERRLVTITKHSNNASTLIQKIQEQILKPLLDIDYASVLDQVTAQKIGRYVRNVARELQLLQGDISTIDNFRVMTGPEVRILAQASAEHQLLLEKFEKYEEDYRSLQQKLTEADQECRKLGQDISALQQTYESLQKEQTQTKQILENTETALTDTQNNYQKMKDEYEKTGGQLKQKSKEYVGLQTTLQQKDHQLSEKDREISEHIEAYNKLIKELMDEQYKHKVTKSNLEKSQQQQNELSTQLVKQTDQLQTEQQRRKELAELYKNKEEAYQQLNGRFEECGREIVRLDNAWKNMQNERDQWENKYKNLEPELQKEQEAKAVIQGERNGLEQKLTAYHNQQRIAFIEAFREMLGNLFNGIKEIYRNIEARNPQSPFKDRFYAVLYGGKAGNAGLNRAIQNIAPDALQNILRLQHSEQIYEITKQDFYAKYLIYNFFGHPNTPEVFDVFMRLFFYSKVNLIEDTYRQDGIDVERLRDLRDEVVATLRSHFAMKVSDIALFIDSFDQAKHDRETGPDTHRLNIPGLSDQIYRLANGRIYDIAKVGIQSRELNIYQKPRVIYRTSYERNV